MLKEKTNEVILELSAGIEQLSENLNLNSDLGFDSLRIVELIMALEETFGIEFNESDLDPENLNQVSDIYALMSKYSTGVS